jgi:hypothetical protein
MSTLDRVMPRYDVRTVHETWFPARPKAVFGALMELTGKEIRLLGPLEAIRMLPHVRRGQGGTPAMCGSILEAYRLTGFVDLGGQPGAEVVLGAVGRFWSLNRNTPLRTIRSREDFLAFAEPGLELPDEAPVREVALEPHESVLDPCRRVDICRDGRGDTRGHAGNRLAQCVRLPFQRSR